MTAQYLQALLSDYQFRLTNEDTLQLAIAQCFDRNAIVYQREVRLNEKDRPDFMVYAHPKDGKVANSAVAVEVKVGGSPAEVIRQLHRYSQHQCIDEILLVTTQPKHLDMPVFNGKPILVCLVGGTAGL